MIRTKIIIATIVCLGFLNSCKDAQKTDYIFPPNYKGHAIVLYNVKWAKKSPYKNGRIQIEIPNCGILFTSARRPDGILDNRYFMKTTGNELKKIYPDLEAIPHSDSISSYILAESYQSIRMNRSVMLNQKSNSNSDELLDYDEMVIFKIASGFADTVANKTELDKYLDSITPTLLKPQINH